MTLRLIPAAAAVLLATSLFAESSTWRLDPTHSAAQFTVRHMMISNVRGEFGKPSGTVQYDPADVRKTQIEVLIDVNNINTREPDRDKHLKSADFFDVQKFPSMTFKSKRAEPAGSGKLKLTGDLTIHGVTKEVTFDVEGPTQEIKDQRGNVHMGASAATKINRKDFGLMWNRAIEGGGILVGDEVAITFDVELIKQAPAPTGGR